MSRAQRTPTAGGQPPFRRSPRIHSLMNRTSPGPDHRAESDFAVTLRRSASDPFQTAAAMLRFGAADADLRTAQPGNGNLGEQGTISRGRVIPYPALGRRAASFARSGRGASNAPARAANVPAAGADARTFSSDDYDVLARPPVVNTVTSIHGQAMPVRRTISRKERGPTESRRTVGAARLLKEAQQLMKDAPTGCHAAPKADDLFEWAAVIEGPSDTVYNGGTFFFDIHLPRDYPFNPPKVVFRTRIYHCNINTQGEVCVDVLRDKWSSTMTISTVLLSILSLMYQCNPDDALVSAVGKQFKEDRELFNKTARIWTTRYAN